MPFHRSESSQFTSSFQKNEPRWVRWLALGFLSLGILLLFFRVDKMPIYEWDEARLAANAQEMLENGDLLVTYFGGEPDHWNTKPPLMIILEAGSMAVFGQSTLAFRLPALIAALITMIWLSWLGRKLTGSDWGLLAGGILASMPGYMQHHAARTGDYDALLTLFTTLLVGQFLLYLFKDQSSGRWLWMTIFLTLATLTKGIASYFFLPGMAISLLIFFPLLKKDIKRIMGFGILHFIIVLGYYFLRESLDPGYLQAVWENELGGRFGQSIEQHSQPFWFYLNNFISHGSAVYFLFLPFWGYFLWTQRTFRSPLMIISIILAFFELIISAAGTKLFWYSVPSYPLFALGFTLISYHLIRRGFQGIKRKGLYFTGVGFVLIFSFGRTLEVLVDHMGRWEHLPAFSIPFYLKDHSHNLPDNESVFAYYDGYHTQIQFYMKPNNLKKWVNPEPWVVKDSSLVIFSQSEVRKKLEGKFQLTLVDSITDPNPVYVMRVQRKKN